MNEKKKDIGLFIKDLRNQRELKISTLAEFSGVSQPYLSQIESGKRKPSLEIVRKLAEALDADFYELAWIAGYYTQQEIENVRQQKKFFASMTPEEFDAYQLEDLKSFKRNINIRKYKESRYVRLEDFLNDDNKNFYIDDHKLSKEDIKMLIALYGGKEKNYPSDKQIEDEYEDIKNNNQENEKLIEKGQKLIIMNSDYDIDTNEDV